MKLIARLFPYFAFFSPVVASAQLGKNSSFRDIVKVFTDLGVVIIPFLGVVALLVFAFGVGKFIRDTGSGKETDKSMLLWGVIGMFILFTIWAIIAFLRSEFGFGNDIGIPQITL